MEFMGKQVAAHHVLKAMAIFSMILIHSWSLTISNEEYMFFSNSWMISIAEGITRLSFWGLWIPALAGSSLRFRLGREQNLGGVASESFRVGLWLLGFGAISYLGSDFLRVQPLWNPPTFLATCFLLFGLLNKCCPKAYVWICGIFVLSMETLCPKGIFPQVSHPSLRFFFDHVLLGTTGEWSMSPWFLGFIFGYYLTEIRWPKTVFLLIALIALISPSSWAFLKTPLLLRNEKLPFTLFIAIHALLGTAFLILTQSQRIEKWGSAPIVRCLSQGSLYIFIFHLLVLYLMLPFFQELSLSVRLVLMPVALVGWSLLIGELTVNLQQNRLSIRLIRKKGHSLD